MKSWEDLIADENVWMNKHYTPGRGGAKIRKIVLHHNAANLTIRGCWEVWQTREASAHYQVDVNGRIGQFVHDWDKAWHAGDANTDSIGIEHANNHVEPYTISEATLDNGAHLVAALCKYYGLGRPQWHVNVFGHRDYMSTECPGEIYDSQRATYMARAAYWYDVMSGKTSSKTSPGEPAPKVPTVVVDGWAGEQTVSALQHLLGTPADGWIDDQYEHLSDYVPAFTTIRHGTSGSPCIRALQSKLGVETDGQLGHDTVTAWQRKLGVVIDGIAGSQTVTAIQKALNHGRIW